MITLSPTVNYSYLTGLIGHMSGLSHLRATQLFTEELSGLELTPKQVIALEFIANNRTVSQKEIAAHIGTTPTVMVGILDALSKRGLVERVRSAEDRRRHTVAVTTAGHKTLPKIETAAKAVESRLLAESNLTATEWDQLVLLMQKLTDREEKL